VEGFLEETCWNMWLNKDMLKGIGSTNSINGMKRIGKEKADGISPRSHTKWQENNKRHLNADPKTNEKGSTVTEMRHDTRSPIVTLNK
jgi:hypothetical protein